MAFRDWLASVKEKINPAQRIIYQETGDAQGSVPGYTSIVKVYDEVGCVRRGIDLIVNGASTFDFDVAEKINGVTPVIAGVRKTKVDALLNYQPNLYQDISKFRRNIYLDLLLDGNAFIYYDGVHIYHLPAANVEILTDKVVYVKGYKYSGEITFKPEEIIAIHDNSSTSVYRGTSRLKSVLSTLNTRKKMLAFQDTFFVNGAVPGLVLKSPNVLGDKVKQKLIESWQREYSPTKGGKRPLVLDGGLDVSSLSDVNFRELDFKESVVDKEREILEVMGVPPILLNGGNNANISPNLRLFYLETVLPIVRLVNVAFERFFGYNLDPETSRVSALQPDMSDSANYYTSLVNGGVLTPNEARAEIRYEKVEGHDDLRIPANIAGSAANPSQGGRPTGGK